MPFAALSSFKVKPTIFTLPMKIIISLLASSITVEDKRAFVIKAIKITVFVVEFAAAIAVLGVSIIFFSERASYHALVIENNHPLDCVTSYLE